MGRETCLSVSSVLLVLTLLLTWSKQCGSLKATLKSINASATTDDSMPKHVDIRMTTEDNYDIRLDLERAPHSSVPLVLVDVSKGGHFVTESQLMMPDKNVDFYQDPQNKATLQITRQRNKARENESFDMRGHIVIKGWVYYLNTEQGYEPNDGHDTKYRSDVPRDSPEEVIVESLVGRDLILEKENLFWQLDSDYLSQEVLRTEDHAHGEEPLRWPSSGTARARRQSRQQYFIDIVAVVDYSLFMKFKGLNDSWDLQTIYKHYALTFNEVDLIYKALNTSFLLTIQVIKIIVLTTAAASNFSEFYRHDDKLPADSSLQSLTAFSRDQGKEIIGEHDHVMAFTGLDLFAIRQGEPNYNVAGIANVGVMCRQDGTSSSVIEESFGYLTAIVATHELGHSLSARHDGDGNMCDSHDGYIMAVTSSTSKVLNQYHFSNCSSESIQNYIRNVLRSQEGVECLTKALKVSDSVPNVNDTLPGLEKTVDEQCRTTYGNDSYFCRQLKPQDICRNLWCGLRTNLSICQTSQMALRGTPCGNKKVCSLGLCVNDVRGLDVPDTCLFGDAESIIAFNMSCEQLIGHNTMHCYNSFVQDLCCKSCLRHHSPVKGCEYGDKVRGCQLKHCKNYPAQCCKTCTPEEVSTEQQSKNTTIGATASTLEPLTHQRTDPKVDPLTYSSRVNNELSTSIQKTIISTKPKYPFRARPRFIPRFTRSSTSRYKSSSTTRSTEEVTVTDESSNATSLQTKSNNVYRKSVSGSGKTFHTYHFMFIIAIIFTLSSIVNIYVNSIL